MPTGVYIRKIKRKFSKKGRENIKNAQIKKWQNPEYRDHMSKVHKGNKVSEKIKKRLSEHWIKEKNPRWNGGKTKSIQGYVMILAPNHPVCRTRKNRQVKRSRLIIEKQIGRYLTPKETVHHINKIKDDDRLENLIAFINDSAHQHFHKNPNNISPEKIIFDGRKLYPLFSS